MAATVHGLTRRDERDAGTLWLAHASGQPGDTRQRLAEHGATRDSRVAIRGDVTEPVPWLYLGQDYLRLLDWQNELETTARDTAGECVFCRRPIARELDDVASHLRRPFLDLMADLGQRHDSLAWWTSRVAERNTMVSPLFLHCCHLNVALASLTGDRRRTLVVSESWAVLHTIDADARATGRPVRWVTPSRSRWRVRIRRYANLLRHARRFLRERLAIGRLAREVEPANPASPSHRDRPTVLLRTFVDEACMRDDGVFRDRQLVGIDGWLESQGIDTVTVPVLYNIKRSYRDAWHWLHRNRRRFLNADARFTFSDLLVAIGIGVRQAFLPRGRVTLDGIDVTGLFEEERLRFALDRDVLDSILLSRLPRRLRQEGVPVDLVIEGYENMLPERGTIAGFRRHWPAVKVVGFQHPVVPPLLLCHYVTSRESRRAPLPDRIVCNGSRFRDALLSDGLDPNRVVVGPALRYAHLAEPNDTRLNRWFDPSCVRSCILVALPLEMGSAVELLSKVLPALGDSPYLRVKVKPHPMMRLSELMHHCGVDRMPDHFEIVDGGIDEWLDRVRFIISAGSAVLYEAVAAGVPAMAVGREGGLNLNPLAWLKPHTKNVPGTSSGDSPAGLRCITCYSPDEIRVEAQRLWTLSAADRQQYAHDTEAIRRTSFNPTNDETLGVFIAGLMDVPISKSELAGSNRG